MSTFNKPYIAGLFRSSARARHYPYAARLLKRYDIFPLFVPDGGAFFSTADRFGLLPIAQRYLLTGEEKWAKSWFVSFADWVRANPYTDDTPARPPADGTGRATDPP